MLRKETGLQRVNKDDGGGKEIDEVCPPSEMLRCVDGEDVTLATKNIGKIGAQFILAVTGYLDGCWVEWRSSGRSCGKCDVWVHHNCRYILTLLASEGGRVRINWTYPRIILLGYVFHHVSRYFGCNYSAVFLQLANVIIMACHQVEPNLHIILQHPFNETSD